MPVAEGNLSAVSPTIAHSIGLSGMTYKLRWKKSPSASEDGKSKLGQSARIRSFQSLPAHMEPAETQQPTNPLAVEMALSACKLCAPFSRGSRVEFYQSAADNQDKITLSNISLLPTSNTCYVLSLSHESFIEAMQNSIYILHFQR